MESLVTMFNKTESRKRDDELWYKKPERKTKDNNSLNEGDWSNTNVRKQGVTSRFKDDCK